MKKFLIILQALTLVLCFTTIYATADDNEKPVGTPIYTADDFNKLYESSESFYLANDIDLSKATCYIGEFSGTLDGNGYCIRNMNQPALIQSAEDATIKNLKLVDIKGEVYTPIVSNAQNCVFQDISVSGEITIDYKTNEDNGEILVGGIAGVAMGCTFTNCKTDLDMNIYSQAGVDIYGIAKCWRENGATGKTSKLKNCYTNGDITVEVNNIARTQVVDVIGLCGGGHDNADVVSCGNTGNINVTCNGKAYDWIVVSGLTESASSVSKCYNTGDISVNGKLNTINVQVAGISCSATNSVKESYNTGDINVNSQCKTCVTIAGISSFAEKGVFNSYNIGNIKFVGVAASDSSAAGIMTQGGAVKNCYSIGSIKNKSKKIEKFVLGPYPDNSSKGNYYIKGKPFASGSYTAKNAKKVNKITAKNCSKLSSKYWAYSKTKGRMILKNNKEK